MKRRVVALTGQGSLGIAAMAALAVAATVGIDQTAEPWSAALGADVVGIVVATAVEGAAAPHGAPR